MAKKKTTEQFIEDAIKVHGDKYDYSLVEYTTCMEKVKIFCKYHNEYFLQSPNLHRTSGCPKCGEINRIKNQTKSKESFITDAIKVHGDKYDYSLVDYKGNKSKVSIICKTHNEVFEIRPDSHISSKQGCTKCALRRSSNDKELFLERAIKKYGNKYDYSETNIISCYDKIEVRCKEHDVVFKLSIENHILGQGCPVCSAINYSKIRTKTTDYFINKSKEIHGNRFDYTDTIYINSKVRVDIKCDRHGTFKQYPQNHLNGGGCRKCADEIDIFKREDYVKLASNASLYLIKMYNENEEFYKIGKTIHTVKIRFSSTIPYKYEIIDLINYETGFIYDLENELHRKYNQYKYKPLNSFAGHTECYTLDLPIEEIQNIKEKCQKE